MAKNESTAMVVVSTDIGFRRQMEPESLDGLQRYAAIAAKMGLCRVKTPEEAIIRMLAGRENGLTMMTSMKNIYVIDGNPAMAAALKQAICQSHPDICEKFEHVSTDARQSTFLVKRKGQDEHKVTYTIERATVAGLAGKDNWKKNPERMLQARARGEAADLYFPDLLAGFATAEEAYDDRHAIDVVGVPVEEESGVNVSAPERDIATEVAALKQIIIDAHTKELRIAAVEQIKAFARDVGDHHAEELIRLYNMTWPPKGAQGQAPAAEAAG